MDDKKKRSEFWSGDVFDQEVESVLNNVEEENEVRYISTIELFLNSLCEQG